ncbi:MAG: YcjF family protein [Aeromonas sp.]
MSSLPPLKQKIEFELPEAPSQMPLRASAEFEAANFTAQVAAEAPFVTETPPTARPLATATDPAHARRTTLRWPWLRSGLAAVSLLALGQWGLFISEQWARSPWLGGAWLGTSALVLGGVSRRLWHEARALTALRQRDTLRQRAAKLSDDPTLCSGAGRTFCQQLACPPAYATALSQWQTRVSDHHSDDEVLRLYSATVLAEQDAAALACVSRWASETAALIAISPLASVDMLLMVWRNLRLLDGVAAVYGVHLSFSSRLALLRLVLANVVYAGASELITEIGADVMGAELTAKLSARAAQGVGAGLLTARLGLRVMDACRPLPWRAQERPGLSALRQQLVRHLAAQLTPFKSA